MVKIKKFRKRSFNLSSKNKFLFLGGSCPICLRERKNRRKRLQRRKLKQLGKGLDLHTFFSKLGSKLGIEWHVPGYNYLGPGTRLKQRLISPLDSYRLPVNRLDAAALKHDLAYSKAKNVQEKWNADAKLEREILNFPGKKNLLEKTIAKGMSLKRKVRI